MDNNVTLDNYKLSMELFGHSSDVRSVTGTCHGKIISGSRDKTTKIWKYDDGKYFLEATLSDHKNFVSSVHYMENEKWICTGSNDSTICIYREGTVVPFAILKGHKSAVCALGDGIERNTLVSGSWDKTAKIWKIDDDGNYTSIALEGHEAAVWTVAILKPDKVVTGSADKNILFWNLKGEKLRVLKGHEDCVRGLITCEDGSLISCANDASIRVWNDDGECVKILYGHENYIYSIAKNLNLGNNMIVSGGEDRTIRLWDVTSGAIGKPLQLPAQSVWSVACLKNGDIVTGTSDGIVRIFTRDESRYAKPEELAAYEAALNTKKEETTDMLGGIKHSDLPGPEALEQPGTEDAVRIVRHPDGKIRCYSWNNNKWNEVGDVMGASGGTQGTSGKTLFEGKEYDYVFSVDISDTEPPIKLPYNRGEDPWLAAQKFIHKNNLPQVYLDQVANFIIKNSDTPVIQQSDNAYADPFTGGARYVPGTNSNSVNVVGNADPFTGGSSYNTKESVPQAKHFPINSYMTFENCDASKIRDKMREFSSRGDSNASVSDDVIDAAVKLTDKNNSIDALSVEALQHLLGWPVEILFPILDITRLAVRNEQICLMLMKPSMFNIILNNLITLPANQLMAVRCLTNMLSHTHGRNLIEPKLNDIINILATKIHTGSGNLQIAIASFYLNLSITQVNYANSDKCEKITEGLLEFLKWCNDLEALYRSMQTLGNLICTPYGRNTVAQILSLDDIIKRIRDAATIQQPNGFEKLNDCAKALVATL